MNRRLLPAVLALLPATALAQQALQMGSPAYEALVQNGASSSKVDLVLLPEGYTSAQMSLYASDCARVVNHLFSNVEPYRSNPTAFNVWKVNVLSTQSGVDHLDVSPAVYRTTAFNCYYSGRLIGVGDWNAFSAARARAPAADTCLIIVNDSTYGGAGYFGSVGTAYNGYWLHEVAAHELGHAFGYLADEYGGYTTRYSGPEPTEPNATINPNLSTIKWRPYVGIQGVAAYEGCEYYDYGIYRPAVNCLMRSLGVGNCYVCQQQVLARIRQYASGDTTPPSNGSLLVNGTAASTTSLVVSLTSLSATDNVGVTQMRFSNNNATWSPWETYAASRAGWDLSQYGGNGNAEIKTVWGQFRDAAGNVSAAAWDTIQYVASTTAPATPTNVYPPAGATNISLRAWLNGSTYVHPTGVAFAGSRWRVTDLAGGVAYESPIVAPSACATYWHQVPATSTLRYATTYRWSVQYLASNGAWSSWSLPTQFTTLARGPRVVVGLGPAAYGNLDIQRIWDSGYPRIADWARVPWAEYSGGTGGMTRPATGDIDGDGAQEIVVGLGPLGRGRAYVLDDEAHGYASLGYIDLGWSAYTGSTTNAPTYPACGDINGDGRDEIVLGLGPLGQGYVRIFRYVGGSTPFVPFSYTGNSAGWYRVPWSTYVTSGSAPTYPALGDLNGDGRDEMVIGTARYATAIVLGFNGSTFTVWPGTPLAGGFLRTGWTTYDAAIGSAFFPAIGDVDGDGRGEIVAGLANAGQGRLRVFRVGTTVAPLTTTPGGTGWLQVLFAAYCASGNAPTFPACGDMSGDGADEIFVGLGGPGQGKYGMFAGRTFGPYLGGLGRACWDAYEQGATAPTYPVILR